MSPSNAAFVAPPPIAPIVAPAPIATAPSPGGYGGGYYGALPFNATPGGGDRDRSRSLPLAGEHIFDQPGTDARADDSLVIGGDSDGSLYNEEDIAKAEQLDEKGPLADDLDDEEDLW
jgi:hypothetical protein